MPLAFTGIAESPDDSAWRGFMPPMIAPTTLSAAAASCASSGAPSRLSATAWPRNSIWLSSSVAVIISMSRKRLSPRAPMAWKKYCIATRISPSTPPMACWSHLAKTGSGVSTRTSYCNLLEW